MNTELVKAMKVIVQRELNQEYVPESWEEWEESEIIYLASRPAGLQYVNVYMLDRVCGGAEEGGWWYDTGSVELSLVCDSVESAEAYAVMLLDTYRDNGNRYSVIYYRKSPDFLVEVDNKPAADWPREQPHYE